MEATYDKVEVIKQTEEYVREALKNAESGHAFDHIQRVWKLTKRIGQQVEKKAKINIFVAELGALLHDIADYKFHDGDETVGPRYTRQHLKKLNVDEDTINQVVHIVECISFKGAHTENKMKSIEGLVVQDADRIEAIGAIGIARCFAYGGAQNRKIHDPLEKPTLHTDSQSYQNNKSSSINHFYEKLLLIQDKLNTEEGQQIAAGRHQFMQDFLDRFYKEWDCTD